MGNNLVKNSILKVLRKNIKIDILLFFAVCGVVIASLIPPQILKYIIDGNLVPKSTNRLLFLATIYTGILLFIGIFNFMKEAVLTILGQKITKEIRLGMMEKLKTISAMFFSTNDTGTVVSRFINDVDAINSMFTGGIIGMMVDCLKIIGIVFSIWMFSKQYPESIGLMIFIICPRTNVRPVNLKPKISFQHVMTLG